MKDSSAISRRLHLMMRSLKTLRTAGFKKLALAVGYGASLLTTAFIVWLIIGTSGTGITAKGPTGNTADYLLILVSLNLILLLGLVFSVVMRVVTIARSRGADAGARLHLRFVFLFSLAAVTPAIIVALSFTFLNDGITTWFSDRVKTTVENGYEVAGSYLEEARRTSARAMSDMRDKVESPNGRNFYPDRLAFALALKAGLEERGELSAIYVIDRTGQVLARAELPGSPVYMAPSPEVIQDVAATGPKAYPYGDPDAIRLIYPLQNYNGAMLYGIKLLPKGIYFKVQAANQAIADYKETTDKKLRAQAIFFMAYLEAVLLVLIGAIWGGTSAAESIAVPVARLVQAADKVAGGDLNARVRTVKQSEDIAVLSRAFNRMTSDLQNQQAELKAAGEEAESRRRFIETVLSEISAGIVGLDENEQISAINRHASNFLGVASDDAIGLRIRELAPEIAELLDKVSVHRVEETEVDLVRRGETRRVRVRVSGLDTGGAVLTFDDITRLIAAQRNAAWKDVARRIAHEIKNPLTPIQLSAERLRKKYRGQIHTDGETFDRLTDTIVRQVGDIGRMVDEFSSFARMPAPNFSEEDAAEMVRAAVFAQRVARPDIAIEIVEPLPDITVICDGRMLSQALGNVLKNGGEAISSRLMRDGKGEQGEPADGVVGHLRVEMKQVDGELVIEVEDDGIGLPEKDRDRLTEPYVTTREKGTGLGLAIVKRILEDHGGEFYLNDAVNLSGARAVLRLPRMQAGRNAAGTNAAAKVVKLVSH
ncbi:PAS domain-containing sensor histidine kinase [Asticcacaulis sp. 201]|uniref:sensor histidine kinase NtrY-like n=1 Tax=Asticcacaulis sp. 201 TaxID=3028787 RepID=UPI002915EE9F|nr:PAS domain-containing sensor histidine kinase [Asticcacaulis sp. 201]MDV6329363.1 PAS domain-containing sensor histidine kinase [Asticcacaulis sp. 201]